MTHSTVEGAQIRAARPGDVEPALDLLVSSLVGSQSGDAPVDRSAYRAQLAAEIGLDCAAEGNSAAEGSNAAEGLFVVEQGGQIVGATALSSRPGRVADLVVPVLLASAPSNALGAMLSLALDSPRARSARLVQSLLRPEQQTEREAFIKAGFDEVSELLYLLCPQQALAVPADEVDAGDTDEESGLVFQPMDPERPTERDRQVIAATYKESLDCPALEDARDIEDELASYYGGVEFVLRRWYLVRHEDADVGCLLLAAQADRRFWEIVYVGLVPEARGRGWGQRLVRKAQAVAASAGARGLVLAVDARNTPAVDMYDRTGFVRWERRLVHLFRPQ